MRWLILLKGPSSVLHCCAFYKVETFEYGSLPILLHSPLRCRFAVLANPHSTRLCPLTLANTARTSLW